MKTIIEMAREADPKANLTEPYRLDPETRTWLERFAELVRADEREACEMAIEELPPDAVRSDCAAAIRSRGNT